MISDSYLCRTATDRPQEQRDDVRTFFNFYRHTTSLTCKLYSIVNMVYKSNERLENKKQFGVIMIYTWEHKRVNDKNTK